MRVVIGFAVGLSLAGCQLDFDRYEKSLTPDGSADAPRRDADPAPVDTGTRRDAGDSGRELEPDLGVPPTECPDDMVSIDEQFCVDRYEMSVWSQADCGGVQYGLDIDGLPPWFPERVASPGCEGTCNGEVVVAPTRLVYGCSLLGAMPSSSMTWFQARRLCSDQGKRLCTRAEFEHACGGPERHPFPTGASMAAEACNIGSFDTAETGIFEACEGGYPGLFDMVGNISAWLEECEWKEIQFRCYQSDGRFDVPGASCRVREPHNTPDNTFSDHGARCCKSL